MTEPKQFPQNVVRRFKQNSTARRLGLVPTKYGIREPILVYQPGKVGSRSVHLSLRQLNLDVPVYHSHHLAELEVAEEWARTRLADPSKELEGLARDKELYERLHKPNAPRLNLVSLVRAPIPRMISSFFQYLPARVKGIQAGAENQTLTAAELAEIFIHQRGDRSHERWFDVQVKGVFGLDVYAQPFAHSKGYQLYENKKARLVIIRLEDLNRVVAPAMDEMLHIPDFQLVNTNVGEQKWYANLYKEFLQVLRLPPEYVNEIHGSKYAQYFYTPQELKASVARWTA